MTSKYLPFGDLNKPFHRPECECNLCEQWRKDAYDKETDATEAGINEADEDHTQPDPDFQV